LGRDEEQGAEKDDEGNCSLGPMAGGYYWLPTPGHPSVALDVVTCHQLGFDTEFGHVEMWNAVLDRLAAAWGQGRSRPAAAAQGLLLRFAKRASYQTGQTISNPPRGQIIDERTCLDP
jgi:hypothetical protein